MLFLFFTVCSCQKDELFKENHGENTSGFKYQLNEKTYMELSQEGKFNHAFSTVFEKLGNGSNVQGKSVMEEQYGFTIDSTRIHEFLAEDYVSYTFLIHRETVDGTFFENLVVTVDSTDVPKAYTVKYTLNSEPVYIPEDDAHTLDAEMELTPIDYNNAEAKTVVMPDGCTIATLMCPWGDDHPATEVCIGEERGDLYWVYDSSNCTPSTGGGGDGIGPPSVDPGEGGGGGGDGGDPFDGDGPRCDRCPPPIIVAPVLPEKEECTKIKNLIDKDVETAPRQKVKDLLQELNANTAILNKEMGYYLNPETTLENNFIPFYFEGEENADEVSINFGSNAVSAIMHIHYNNEQTGKEQLSIFSLSDLYQIYASINSGHIFNPPTFTSFVVTEHGTKYALQINDANAFLNSKLATYFVGWEFGNFRKSAEDRYEELKGINVKNSNETNEENFAKLIAEGNMGLTLLKSTDGNFENWTKIEYINGEKIETSCN